MIPRGRSPRRKQEKLLVLQDAQENHSLWPYLPIAFRDPSLLENCPNARGTWEFSEENHGQVINSPELSISFPAPSRLSDWRMQEGTYETPFFSVDRDAYP